MATHYIKFQFVDYSDCKWTFSLTKLCYGFTTADTKWPVSAMFIASHCSKRLILFNCKRHARDVIESDDMVKVQCTSFNISPLQIFQLIDRQVFETGKFVPSGKLHSIHTTTIFASLDSVIAVSSTSILSNIFLINFILSIKMIYASSIRSDIFVVISLLFRISLLLLAYVPKFSLRFFLRPTEWFLMLAQSKPTDPLAIFPALQQVPDRMSSQHRVNGTCLSY